MTRDLETNQDSTRRNYKLSEYCKIYANCGIVCKKNLMFKKTLRKGEREREREKKLQEIFEFVNSYTSLSTTIQREFNDKVKVLEGISNNPV